MGVTNRDIRQMVREAAAENNIDPALALAIAKNESGFNPNTVGPTGDYGVMQLTAPALADINQALGTNYSLSDNNVRFDPELNIRLGMTYLRLTRDRYGASTPEEMARMYNGGPGGARKSATEEYWRRVSGYMPEFGSPFSQGITSARDMMEYEMPNPEDPIVGLANRALGVQNDPLTSSITSLQDLVNKGDWWDNELDTFENYTYNIEFFVVPEEDARTFYDGLGGDMLSKIETNSWPSSDMKRVVIASTGVTTEFNVTDLEVQSLGANTSNHGLSGLATGLTFNITQVGQTSLPDTLQSAVLLMGYPNIFVTTFFIKITFKGYDKSGGVHTIPNTTKILPFRLTDFDEVNSSTDARGTTTILNGVIARSFAASSAIDSVEHTLQWEVIGESLEDTLANFFTELNRVIERENVTEDSRFISTYSYEVDNDTRERFLANNPIDAIGITNYSKTNLQVNSSTGGQNSNQHSIVMQPSMSILSAIRDMFLASNNVREELTTEKPSFSDLFVIRPEAKPKVGGFNILTGVQSFDIVYHIGIRKALLFMNQIDQLVKAENRYQYLQDIMATGMLNKIYNHNYTGKNYQILDFEVSLNKQLVKTYVQPDDIFSYKRFLESVDELAVLSDRAETYRQGLVRESEEAGVKLNSAQQQVESLRVAKVNADREAISELRRLASANTNLPPQAIDNLVTNAPSVDAAIANLVDLDLGGSQTGQIGILNDFRNSQVYTNLRQLDSTIANINQEITTIQNNISSITGDMDRLLQNAVGQRLSNIIDERLNVDRNWELVAGVSRTDSNGGSLILAEELDDEMSTKISTMELTEILEVVSMNAFVFKRQVVNRIREINRNIPIVKSTNTTHAEVSTMKYYEGMNADISMMEATMTIKGDPYWLENYVSIEQQKEIYGNKNNSTSHRNNAIYLKGNNYAFVISNKADGTDRNGNIKVSELIQDLYLVRNITSKFSGGLFTQTLDMVKNPMPQLLNDTSVFSPPLDSDTGSTSSPPISGLTGIVTQESLPSAELNEFGGTGENINHNFRRSNEQNSEIDARLGIDPRGVNQRLQ